ncbi:MAG: hypothetical protein HYX93_04665 [Chloroflexi bacterium]|nr:hypothetical protein [Chloroflexota bacterium]
MHELHHLPPPAVLGMTPQDVTEDYLRRHESAGPRFQRIASMLAVLLAIGVVGLVLRISSGFDDRTTWGYYAAVFAYILLTAQSAVLVSVALRMLKAHWRRPLAKISELFAVVGLFNFLIMIPSLWVLPSTDGRRSLWFEWPGHSPHLWDTISMGILVVCGLALLYVAAIPDLAAVRDHSSGPRQARYRRLSLGWEGTSHQWRVLHVGISLLGGFYFLMLIFVHTMISVDFSMSLVPGWKDAIYPTFHALSGLQGGIATVLVTMFVMRRFGGLQRYIEVDQFWGLSKLLLATSLLWFYFWWAGFYTYWYGRTPAEQSILKFLMFETYKTPFILAWVFCFPLPFFTLMWNVVRKTDWGPALAGSFVLIGAFLNMVRLYVPAFSVEDITAHVLEVAPPANLPDGIDVMIVVGVLAGALLVYMLASRLFPILSLWELKEGLLLQRVRRLLKTEIRVLAKPE